MKKKNKRTEGEQPSLFPGEPHDARQRYERKGTPLVVNRVYLHEQRDGTTLLALHFDPASSARHLRLDQSTYWKGIRFKRGRPNEKSHIAMTIQSLLGLRMTQGEIAQFVNSDVAYKELIGKKCLIHITDRWSTSWFEGKRQRSHNVSMGRVLPYIPYGEDDGSEDCRKRICEAEQAYASALRIYEGYKAFVKKMKQQ